MVINTSISIVILLYFFTIFDLIYAENPFDHMRNVAWNADKFCKNRFNGENRKLCKDTLTNKGLGSDTGLENYCTFVLNSNFKKVIIVINGTNKIIVNRPKHDINVHNCVKWYIYHLHNEAKICGVKAQFIWCPLALQELHGLSQSLDVAPVA